MCGVFILCAKILNMADTREKFIQANSPDGGFLASLAWRKFQTSTGKKTYHIEGDHFSASIIRHSLSLVGNYFYVPRGPVLEIRNQESKTQKSVDELIRLAKNESAGWIRIEPATDGTLETLKERVKFPIEKAPHDVQPKEVFIISISESEDEILSAMKPKARYNIRLAEKKGVKVLSKEYRETDFEKYFKEFLRLVKVTAKRDRIIPHPDRHYEKMFKAIPAENIRLYAAEYDGKVIASNLVVFFGDVATYLHGASDNIHRNLMAPYLLQWKQIMDAKAAGCTRYDFGGISSNGLNSWTGITRFKLGFSPEEKATVFPGSYDIIIDRKKYLLYLILSKATALLKRIKK